MLRVQRSRTLFENNGGPASYKITDAFDGAQNVSLRGTLDYLHTMVVSATACVQNFEFISFQSDSSTAPFELDGSGSEQDLLENDSLSSTETSFDEHTLTGFGDISHSEIGFMPSIPSEIIPERSSLQPTNAKRPLPPSTFRKIMAKKLEVGAIFSTFLIGLLTISDAR